MTYSGIVLSVRASFSGWVRFKRALSPFRNDFTGLIGLYGFSRGVVDGMIARVSEIEIESRMSFKNGAFIIRIKLFV